MVQKSMIASVIMMIMQRNFEGEQTISSLTSATKGLSPFVVPFLTEHEIDEYNTHVSALEEATSTTVKDVATMKLKATAPTTFDGLIKQLKCYANLLYTIFEDMCPLSFMDIQCCIKQLEDFTSAVQCRMSHEIITSILWILHLQSCHFMAGKMQGSQARLVLTFKLMVNEIEAHQPITHSTTRIIL